MSRIWHKFHPKPDGREPFKFTFEEFVRLVVVKGRGLELFYLFDSSSLYIITSSFAASI